MSHRDGKPINVLFLGEPLVRSAPSKTLIAALSPRGFACRFVDWYRHGHIQGWLDEYQQTDAIVLVEYGPLDPFRMHVLAHAAARSIPIIRWWVGTDVPDCFKDWRRGISSRVLNRLVAVNVAVAPHLQTELAGYGVSSLVIPSVLDSEPERLTPNDPKVHCKALLVYLPNRQGQDREFYGERFVRTAIQKNPDINFVVVADDDHTLAPYPNVESLGWVDDMEPVWKRVSGVLRVTTYDGLPRMILECLLRGKYAIYSWPLPGAWLAKTEEDVQRQVERFRETTEFNFEGQRAARQLLTPNPGDAFADLIRATITESKRHRRRRKHMDIVASWLRLKVSRLFRRPK